MADDAPNYHIQITNRMGAIVIEGPDKDWVAEQAHWAITQHPAPPGGMGFSMEQGGTATTERAETYERPPYLGEGGPSV